jgi:hypothetical protein
MNGWGETIERKMENKLEKECWKASVKEWRERLISS